MTYEPATAPLLAARTVSLCTENERTPRSHIEIQTGKP
jgi:hypothetical protein